MRIVNRVLGVLLALALVALSVIVIVEVVGYFVSGGPVLVNYHAISEWARSVSWANNAFVLWGTVVAVVALIWLLLELKPTRVREFDARSDAEDVDTVVTRSGVEQAVRQAVERVDGVSSSSVTARRRSVDVRAKTAEREQSAADALRPDIDQAVSQRLDELDLKNIPKQRVQIQTSGG